MGRRKDLGIKTNEHGYVDSQYEYERIMREKKRREKKLHQNEKNARWFAKARRSNLERNTPFAKLIKD